jgi:hypothetical protein
MPAGHSERRNIVFLKGAFFGRSLFTEKKGTYEQNHQSDRKTHDVASENSNRSTELAQAHCRMAATRTGNTFRPRRSKVAPGFYADAIGDNRECGWLGGQAMIMISIFWALVLALFTINREQPNETNRQT